MRRFDRDEGPLRRSLPDLHAKQVEARAEGRVPGAPHPSGPLADQTIRPVTIGELNRSTSNVVHSVRDGERVVITCHGSPQAVVLGLRDAMELLIAAELPALAARAHADLQAGRVEAVQPPGPNRVRLAGAATAAWERMRPRDRRLLRQALVNGEADEERLLWLPSGRWVVAFSYVGDATALVHQVYEVKELERALIGDEIWTRRARCDRDRLMHWRAPWQLGREQDASG